MNDDKIDKIKIIIIGSYSIGKTALMNKYFTGDFSAEHVTTVQSNMRSKRLSNNSNKEVILNVWDTAGQEKYGQIVKMFYLNSQIAMVCFDFEDQASKDRIDDLVFTVQDCCDGCIIYLVATRIDKQEDTGEIIQFLKSKQISLDEHYNHKLKILCFMTSAKTGEGVNELFQKAADENTKMLPIQIDINQSSNNNCC